MRGKPSDGRSPSVKSRARAFRCHNSKPSSRAVVASARAVSIGAEMASAMSITAIRKPARDDHRE
eukprot:scaffold177801_cov28-Tisochrysis_lutea.AAC.5